MNRALILLCLLVSSLSLQSCKQYYLSICQEWVDVRYLASSHVGTPDPRQENPPLGQKLIIDWRIPKEVLKKKPEVVLDLILWDYSTRQIRIPIKRKMDFSVFKLFGEEYKDSGGILTYKAEIITEDSQVFCEWKHQLWVNLITINQETVQESIESAK